MTSLPPLSRCRAVIIWPKFGPYHVARVSALANHSFVQAIPVETFSDSRYGSIFDLNGSESGIISLDLKKNSSNSDLRRVLQEQLDRLAPDTVFTPGWSLPAALVAIEWCLSHDVPFVVMSASSRIDHPRQAIREALKKRVVRLAGAALVGGTLQFEYAEELGIRPDRIFLGYNVVDNDHFSNGAQQARQKANMLRDDYGLPERFFICCTRLIEKKNLRRLTDAFAKYRAKTQRRPWDLVIIGPGHLKSEIAAQIQELGLNGAAHLLGERPYAALPTYYALASALILPSTTDQWGLVVNEAMAAGLPVLVSNRCGCHRDLVVSGRNGFTFDPFNVDDITNAMVTISSRECELPTMGVASQEIIEDWSLRRFAEGFERAAKVAIDFENPSPTLLERSMLRLLLLR